MKKEPEETEQQKKFGTFFKHDQNGESESSESQQPSLVSSDSPQPAEAAVAVATPVKRTRKVMRKEKVIETFLDEEGFEVRREVEKVIEEEVPIEEESPAAPSEPVSAPVHSLLSSQSQSSPSASVTSPPSGEAKKGAPKAQAKLNAFFKK